MNEIDLKEVSDDETVSYVDAPPEYDMTDAEFEDSGFSISEVEDDFDDFGYGDSEDGFESDDGFSFEE